MKAETSRELLDWQPPAKQEIITHDILPVQGKMILFGRWGSWKSMLAMHTAYCVTQGQRWLGFPTIQTSVMMVQVEIPRATLRKRVYKYTCANGVCVPDNLWWISEPYLRLDHSSIFDSLRMMLNLYQPKLLIIDPLYKSTSVDIMDNHQVLYILDLVDRLINEFGLSVILVSHTIKLPPREPGKDYDWGQLLVGGSYIMNWVDTAIAIDPVSDLDQNLYFIKTRSAEEDLGVVPIRVSRDTLHFIRKL